MTRIRFIGSIFVLVALSVLSDSHATTYFNSGSSCIQHFDNMSAGLVHDSLGTWNNSSTDNSGVVCSFVGWENATIDVSSVQVWAEDQSTSHTLSCFPRMRTTGDTIHTGGTKLLCPTGGGCSSVDFMWTGKNWISWTDPFNSGNSVAGVGVYDVYCVVPPSNLASGLYSRLIRASTTQGGP